MFEKLKIYNYLYSKQERKQLTAEALKAFRMQSGLQQKDVAKLLQISQQTYQTYENGRSEPPIEILVRLSFLYDVPIELLVQQTNFNKETKSDTANKIIEQYEKDIAELKEKIKTADPVTQMQLKVLLEGIEKLNNTIKKTINRK